MDQKEFASLGGKSHLIKDPDYFKKLVRMRKFRPVKKIATILPIDNRQAV